MSNDDLVTRFTATANEWDRHVQSVSFSSNTRDYVNHDSYRKMVELGRPVLPLIFARYKSDDLPWEFVLQDITGVKMISDPNRYSPADVKKLWMQWWESQRATEGLAP